MRERCRTKKRRRESAGKKGGGEGSEVGEEGGQYLFLSPRALALRCLLASVISRRVKMTYSGVCLGSFLKKKREGECAARAGISAARAKKKEREKKKNERVLTKGKLEKKKKLTLEKKH